MATMQKGGGAASYSFSSQPKAVAANRKKYREPGEEPPDTGVYRDLKETCITWDKRVHRGNTYGLYTQNAIKEALQEVVTGSDPAPRRKRRATEKSLFDMPLPEKERIPVDLTQHLVAKEEVIVTETVEAQTDEFLPEPPPEQYRPQKTGMDVATQVEEGELFDFDYEAEPILDVLVNKTLEQSIMETEEEYELEQMNEFKVQWYKRQEAMMKDWSAQIAEEWVRWDKKEAVLAKSRELKTREAQVLLKIQAMAAARCHLQNLVPNAVRSLAEVAFPDVKGMAISRGVMPDLIKSAHEEVVAKKKAVREIDAVVAQRLQTQLSAQQDGYRAHRDRTAAIKRQKFEEKQTRQGKIRVKIDELGDNVLGPIQISATDPIALVNQMVYKWLKEQQDPALVKLLEAWKWGVVVKVNGEAITNAAQLTAAGPGQTSVFGEPPPPPTPRTEGGSQAEEGEGADAA